MTDIVTDTYELHIGLVQHGNAQISNVVAPEEVEIGEPFNIEYDVTNEGPTDTIYGHVMRTDNQQVFEGTDWEESIPSGQVVNKVAQMPPISEPLDVTIVVGYRKQ